MKIDTTPAFTLPEPLPGQPYIEVSALEAGILQLIHTRFMANSQPGESTMDLTPSENHRVISLGRIVYCIR